MIPDWMEEFFPVKGSVPQWRKNVLIPLVLERDGVCWVEDCFLYPSDVHEGIVTRGDVQGWKGPKKKLRIVIHNPINCIALCKEHHKYAPSRKDVLIWSVKEYGLWVLDWFEELPFKVHPIRGILQQVREQYG